MEEEDFSKINNFYELKNEYDEYLKKKVKAIAKDKSLTKNEKNNKYLAMIKRLKVKKQFLKEDRMYKLVENEKVINEFDNKYYNLLEESYKQHDSWIDETKENIMKLKLDTMFNYVNKDTSLLEFDNLKKELKDNLVEHSKLLAQIFSIENANADRIKRNKNDLYGNSELNIKGHILELKEKIKLKEENYKQEAYDIYNTSIMPTIKELSLMSYDDKGYREVIEEEIDEDTTEYKLVLCPYSLKVKEYESDLTEEEKEEKKIQNELNTSFKKEKMKASPATIESEKLVSLTEELSSLMTKLSLLIKQEKPIVEIQEEISRKQKEIEAQQKRFNKIELSKYVSKNKNRVNIPDDLSDFEKQKYLNELPSRVYQKYLDDMTKKEREDFVEKLKNLGIDKIKGDYSKDKRSMTDKKFKTFLKKKLLIEEKKKQKEADEILLFVKSYEDYFKFHHDYDLFPDLVMSDFTKTSLEMKKDLEENEDDLNIEKEKADANKFVRDGKLPSWGSGEEYKEKLNKGDVVFLRKEKTTIFKYDEDVLSSEILTVEDYINTPFKIDDFKNWNTIDELTLLPGQNEDQVLITNDLTKEVSGWVNYNSIYVDKNPFPESELEEVEINLQGNDEQDLALTLDGEDLTGNTLELEDDDDE